MSNSLLLEQPGMDSMEMGVKKEMEPADNCDRNNHLLNDYLPNQQAPLTADQNSSPKKKKESKQESSGGGIFGGDAADVIYDDEDWSSDDDDDDEGIGKRRKYILNGEDEKVTILTRIIFMVQDVVRKSNRWLKRISKGYFWSILFILAYFGYFIVAMNYSFGDESSWRLLVCTVLGVIIITRKYIRQGVVRLFYCVNGGKDLGPRSALAWKRFKFIFQWTMNVGLLVLMLYVLVDEGMEDIKNLRSVPGLIAFIIICLLFSSNPGKINWYVIYWSMGLQFLLALLALKGKWGRDGVLWVQDRLDEFFANSDAGSKLIFGENYKEHYMIFAALPLVFLTNATLALLYYLGAMQLFTRVLGEMLNWVLHTSPVECVAVSGGIFLEGGVMILTLRPFLGSLSKSELFVIITSGLASLGGTYVAILSAYQVSLEYVIPAMLVSAPATFAVCKLMVPENLESKRRSKGKNVDWDMGNAEKERYSSGLDALQGGAVSIIGLLGNVLAVAYVFFSYISWTNHTLEWFGNRVGVDKLSIELIFSYLMYPVSMAMGIDLDDCRRVGMLMGYRIGSTNIIAFFKLHEMKANKMIYSQYMEATNFTGPVSTYRDDITLDLWNQTLANGFLTNRSEVIVTYSLCGFSSALSAGIVMSFLYVLLPKRRKWLSRMALPALIAGNIANCMTGCFASIFY